MTGAVLKSRSHAHPLRKALAPAWPHAGWTSAGVLALLCSGVAWASLPRAVDAPPGVQQQWRALGVAPLSGGGISGMQIAPTDAVQSVAFVARRAAPLLVPAAITKAEEAP